MKKIFSRRPISGTGHDDIDREDLAFEIQAILADLETSPVNPLGPSKDRVFIDETAYARCLTCYRVCSHRAVALNQDHPPRISDHACFACQACVSNCPAQAITASGMTNEDLTTPAPKGKSLVFACRRSAVLAAGPLPRNIALVPIPCACRISQDLILKALVKGADKVMVMGCHKGNCQSGQGSDLARKIVESVLSMPGIPKDKVAWQPISATEPQTFARILSKKSNPRMRRP
ncbi:MAG: hydrogenase iron-sulfur subunit [Desulfobacter sp.]|nr:MAG: hydrogenase iron-sulfur subunit [Desulfobacter sp.]